MGEKVGISPEDARQIAGLVRMIKGYPRPAEGVSLEDVVTGALVPQDFKEILEAMDAILASYSDEVRRGEVRKLLPIFHINLEVPPQAD